VAKPTGLIYRRAILSYIRAEQRAARPHDRRKHDRQETRRWLRGRADRIRQMGHPVRRRYDQSACPRDRPARDMRFHRHLHHGRFRKRLRSENRPQAVSRIRRAIRISEARLPIENGDVRAWHAEARNTGGLLRSRLDDPGRREAARRLRSQAPRHFDAVEPLRAMVAGPALCAAVTWWQDLLRELFGDGLHARGLRMAVRDIQPRGHGCSPG
jgi:hypothetical protein